MTSCFTDRLELRARRIVRSRSACQDSPDALPIVDEIALVLDHLERAREVDAGVRLSLLRVETYIDTELMQMESRMPRYAWQRFSEREKLQRRLGNIERERRDRATSFSGTLASHFDRLFELVSRLEGGLVSHG